MRAQTLTARFKMKWAKQYSSEMGKKIIKSKFVIVKIKINVLKA